MLVNNPRQKPKSEKITLEHNHNHCIKFMKMKKKPYLISAIIGVLLIMLSCNKNELFSKATVETSLITTITEASALCGGLITEDGGTIITSRGVCWSTSPNPTIANDTTINNAGTGPFESLLKGLSPNTTYFVRAYAVNKGGVAYGLQMTFTTKTFSITTNPIVISFVTATTAAAGGEILSDGDSSILTVKSRGVCWNTFPSPTIENRKTIDGIGGGRFTSSIDSLLAFTTYYVRAYATNANGTIYGNEVSFTTLSGLVSLETTEPIALSAYTATSGGTITSDGGAAVTERGVCWSYYTLPTIENNKTSNGSGNGSFASSLTELIPGTTYFVRSYATNCVGTSYGNEVSFTAQSGIVNLVTTSVSSISVYTAKSGGSIQSNGGAPVTSRGICWSTTQTPTIANFKTSNGSGNGNFSSNITELAPSTTYFVRAYATNSIGTSYGNELNFKTLSVLTDIDGNIYNSVTIGTQVWMVENLKTTKYNDGTSIPLVSDNTAWYDLTTPGYCFYNNDAANKNTYGVLYNWYAVNTGKLAPIGWHVPTDAEWNTLKNYLIANGYNYDGTTTGDKIAKSLAATTLWKSHTTVGAIGNDLTKNNTSGFAGLPGGLRGNIGAFSSIGYYGFWLSSTQYSADNAWARDLDYYGSSVGRGNYGKQYGFSVRCVKD